MKSENESVLCGKNDGTMRRRAWSSHSVNLPILRYIKEIEHLQGNLIKVNNTNAPLRCKLLIVPAKGKERMEQDFEKFNVNDMPFEKIMVSQATPPQKANPSSSKGGGDIVKKPTKVKHIHPCVCDLTQKQRERIDDYIRARNEERARFINRVNQIDQEIRMLEEEKLQEQELDRELWDEVYEADDKERCMVRRITRKVSMVSLGMKPVINWKKPPLLDVKYNKVFELRKANTIYCKPPSSVTITEKPIRLGEFRVSMTKAAQLRSEFNRSQIEKYNEEAQKKIKYPNKPEFILNHGKLWYKY